MNADRALTTALVLLALWLGVSSVACHQGRRGPSVPVSLQIRPPVPSVPVGLDVPLRCLATFENGTTVDVTTAVEWRTAGTNVATVGNTSGSKGIARGLSIGATTVTAEDPGTGTASSITLLVTAPVLVSIAVTPTIASIASGTTQAFVAMGTCSDSTVRDLTTSVAWSSTAPSVATISNVASSEGLATGASVGVTTITATDPDTGIAGTTTLTVTAAVLVSLAVTPTNPSIALGTTRQFTAMGTFSDSTVQDLTTAVTWSAQTTSTATISNAPGGEGLASSLAVGTTTITATDPGTGIAGTTTLTVTAAVLVSLAVAPTNPSIALGTTRQFTATGTFSDSSVQDLTTAVAWSSQTTATATIGNAPGSEGLASSAAVGTTVITATDPGTSIAGTTTLTVTAAELVSLAVTPTNPSIALGTTRQFTAMGTFSDSTVQDLTTAVTWSAQTTSTATISNAPGSEGLASSVAVGTTTITATDPGTGIAGTTTLTVTAAVLVSLAVTPADASILLGTTEQFTATGTFSDSAVQDLTTAVTWSSQTTATATISNAPGSEGLASSVAVGTTVITATDPGTSIAGTTTLVVFDNIEFRSAASAGAGSGTLTLTIASPAGVAAADVLVAAIAVRPDTALVTPPGGWTLVRRLDNTASAMNSLLIYTRIAGGSEPANHTWSFSASTGSAGGIAAFDHADTASPIDVEGGQTTSSGLMHATPSVTTTVGSTMVLSAHGFASAATWSAPPAMTEAFDVASQALGSTGICVSMHYALQASAGPTGTRTAVASGDADVGNCAILALRRAP